MSGEIPTRPGWHARALCRARRLPLALFYPRSGKTAQSIYPQLRMICMACPVRVDCREAALTIDRELGVVAGFAGGMTPDERAREADLRHRSLMADGR